MHLAFWRVRSCATVTMSDQFIRFWNCGQIISNHRNHMVFIAMSEIQQKRKKKKKTYISNVHIWIDWNHNAVICVTSVELQTNFSRKRVSLNSFANETYISFKHTPVIIWVYYVYEDWRENIIHHRCLSKWYVLWASYSILCGGHWIHLRKKEETVTIKPIRICCVQGTSILLLLLLSLPKVYGKKIQQ